MLRIIFYCLFSFMLCSCAKKQILVHKSSEPDHHRGKAPHTVSNVTSRGLKADYSKKEKNKRLIITYKSDKKTSLIQAIKKENVPIVYNLRNMNIIVILVPINKIDFYSDRFSSVDGVLEVIEDSVSYTN